MAESFKICPICNTPNHPNTAVCSTCGTSLDDVDVVKKTRGSRQTNGDYDFRYGETDLLEPTAGRSSRSYLVLIVTLAVAIALTAGAIVFWPNIAGGPDDTTGTIGSASPRPTLEIATVTSGPPTDTRTPTPTITFTPSATPTRTPCVQQINAGGSLIGAISACGYSDLAIMPTVMALNNISDAASVQAGQEIIIPWPTETPNPDAAPAATQEPDADPGETGSSMDDSSDMLVNDISQAETTDEAEADEGDNDTNLLEFTGDEDPFAPTATATLPAGVMFHIVQPDENMISIAVQYGTDAKVLSELNPEIDFARCEFGQRFGGPECVVALGIGQRVRVPAPTPVPTLSPTPDPNATATPTPTATFNEPKAISPADRAFFGQNELVTLRWVPTGMLAPDEAYRIDVTDLTTGEEYTALTQDISFILPRDWQGTQAQRHEYEWRVSVVRQDEPENRMFPTQPRTFVWQGNITDEAESE